MLNNRLNISKSVYKEYKEIYSAIEIEIIPFENIYGNFINIKNEEENSYYYIFFNDSKDEIQRTNITQEDKVIDIKIIIDYSIKSFFELFKDCTCIGSINFKQFH